MTETHWTEDSVDDFVHRLSFDFITQLAKRMEHGPFTRAQLAETLRVSKGRISQILNNPSNLTLKKAVTYARALGMKVSVVAYDDNDPGNHNGPVSSEIFSLCWEQAGKPIDFQESNTPSSDTASTDSAVALPERKDMVVIKRASAKTTTRYSFVLDANVLFSLAKELNAATNDQEQQSIAV